MKEPFYYQRNPTAHFCIQNDTNECGHYLGRQGLWKRLIIQSPLFASILIIIIWVSATAIFAAFFSYASLLLFSESTRSNCQVVVPIESQLSGPIREILKHMYYKWETHMFLTNLSGLLIAYHIGLLLYKQKFHAKQYIKMN